MTEKKTEKHINIISKDLFVEYPGEDLLKIVGKNIYYKGEILNDGKRSGIISEAGQLKDFPFWNLLTSEVKHLAAKKMYVESTTPEDILFAKAVLWTVDAMEKKIEQISKMK